MIKNNRFNTIVILLILLYLQKARSCCITKITAYGYMLLMFIIGA